MADPFAAHAGGLSAPAANAAPVAPDDAADLPVTCRALYVGAAGDLAVELAGAAPGSAVIFANVPGGATLPVRVRKVLATGTTAGALMALW